MWFENNLSSPAKNQTFKHGALSTKNEENSISRENQNLKTELTNKQKEETDLSKKESETLKLELMKMTSKPVKNRYFASVRV